MDATVAPHNITYPADLKLFDSARRKSEQLFIIKSCIKRANTVAIETLTQSFFECQQEKAKSQKEI